MGMYDNIKVSNQLIDIDDLQLDGDENDDYSLWQTKTLGGNNLDTYRITADRQLQQATTAEVEVTQEMINEEGIRAFEPGDTRIEIDGWETLTHYTDRFEFHGPSSKTNEYRSYDVAVDDGTVWEITLNYRDVMSQVIHLHPIQGDQTPVIDVTGWEAQLARESIITEAEARGDALRKLADKLDQIDAEDS